MRAAVILLRQQAGQLQPDRLALLSRKLIITLQDRPRAIEQRRQLVVAGLLATYRGQAFQAAHMVGNLLQQPTESGLRFVELAHLLQHLG